MNLKDYEMNLLDETINELLQHNKTGNDVLWVGNRKQFSISWNQFENIANITYDSGFGGAEIMGDLIIVGKDFWLSRGEYDGSEWWNYNTLPIKPTETKTFSKVKRSDYEYDLEELNK